MLFVGAIPREVIAQALTVAPIPEAGDLYVCCSGSFRLEQALGERRPGLVLHSNDVSLFSTAIGRMAVRRPLEWEFTERLAFLQPFGAEDPLERLAALVVAQRMSFYAGKNEHARRHFEHIERNVDHYLELAKKKLEPYLAGLKLGTYDACDFRDHAARAAAKGSWVVAWPPTYKRGYENLFKLLNQNTKWSEPEYRIFDPEDLPAWLDELDKLGARYVVCADHRLGGREPAAMYAQGRARTIWLYSSGATTSSALRRQADRQHVSYEPVVPEELNAETVVDLRLVGAGPMNFLKDRYLKTGLEHSDGQARFVVMLDGRLAGGFIYAQPSFGGHDCIYLLCDFSTSRERRLAKLVAMLATAQEPVIMWERRRFVRVKTLVTTAFTDQPVSMKYRGVWSLIGRKPGFLNYSSEVRRVSTQAIYAEWWRRFGARA